MSEGNSSVMPGVLQNPDEGEEILTISIFNNNDDVDVLKARLKEISANDEDENEEEDRKFLSSESRKDLDHNGSSSCDEFGETRFTSDNSVVEPTEMLCLSTETLIDNVESVTVPSDSFGKMEHKSETEPPLQKPRHLFESRSDSVLSHSNHSVSMSTTKVTSGLLISPSSLTQDVHVSMKEDKQRMSAVLDSLDLHLVYIPTTQQLVAKKSETSNGGNDSSDTGIKNGKTDENETDSSGYISNGGNNVTKASPVKMSDTSSVHSIRLLSPGNVDDNSSVNESECLIRVRDVDNNICDTSEYVCNFPRNDSLLRTFTDASSLSSLSTGTDFSISAASLDDGEGTGHCIDTGDGGFMEINLHSRNSYERGKNPSQDSGFEDKTIKPKRKGISGFLSRYGVTIYIDHRMNYRLPKCCQAVRHAR